MGVLAVRGRVVVPLALAGAVPAVASTQQQPTAASTSLVFDEVTVVDVEHGQLTPGQRVVITGNRIRAVGSGRGTPVPKGAQVVDARGKYLIPGLWDLHTHANRRTDLFYPLFIAHGITGIRDAASAVPLDTLMQWRREIQAGTRVGPPRQLLSGHSIDEVPGCIRTPGELHICVADSADARHLVDSLQAAGADMLKTYSLSRELYFVIAAEARRIGIPFGGHLVDSLRLTWQAASDSGASILDHLNSSGGLYGLCWGGGATVERCQPAAERLRRNGTWWVPTLIFFQGIGPDAPHTLPLLARFEARARALWGDTTAGSDSSGLSGDRASPEVTALEDWPGALRVAQMVGLPILAGTDAGEWNLREVPPGLSLHTELAMYVAEGLTPLAALQSATLNPAKLLHGTDSLGTVAPGKLADLVLLDADPLADIQQLAAVRAVVANGHYFDRAALDRLIADVRVAAWNNPR